jgi:hypothetical protein
MMLLLLTSTGAIIKIEIRQGSAYEHTQRVRRAAYNEGGMQPSYVQHRRKMLSLRFEGVLTKRHRHEKRREKSNKGQPQLDQAHHFLGCSSREYTSFSHDPPRNWRDNVFLLGYITAERWRKTDRA